MTTGLNPCCAGRCSSTSDFGNEFGFGEPVSILVVLDDALVPANILPSPPDTIVSILVVLDDALVPK